MKRIVTVLLYVFLLLTLPFMLSACEKEHVHEFSVEKPSPIYLASEATCTEAPTYYKSCTCGEIGEETFAYGEAKGHTYTELNAANEYLASEATCTEPAKYYKTCKCGNKGTETFSYGQTANHKFENYVSDNNATCTENGTKTAKCSYDGCEETDTKIEKNSKKPHVFNEEIHSVKYLASEATCTEAATYYKSCTCGEIGEETFAYGEAKGHTYTELNAANEYLASEATCTEPAKYYKTCKCGNKGTETFSYGVAEGHLFDRKIVSDEFLNSAATYKSAATYYVSCECGEIGCCTFSYGEPLLYNAIYHWGANGEKEKHTMVRDVCSVCKKEATSVEEFTFEECENGYKITGYKGYGEDVILPSVYKNQPIVSVGEYAFINNPETPDDTIKSLYISENVTDIGMGAFEICIGLRELYLPSRLKSIGESAFYVCVIAEIYNDSDLQLQIGSESNGQVAQYAKQIISNAEQSRISLTTDGYILYTDEDSVQVIGYRGTSNDLRIADNVTAIADAAFAYNNRITRVTIPNNVTSIGMAAFSDCRRLASIYIRAEVETIGINTFSGCVNLTEILLPATISEIVNDAFSGCSRLTSVYYEGSESEWTGITVGTGNENLDKANKYYYSESQPADKIADVSALRLFAAKYGNAFVENAKRFFVGTEEYLTIEYDCVVLEKTETIANIEPYIFDPVIDKDKIVAGVFVKAVITTIATGEVQTCYYNYGIMFSDLQTCDYTVSHNQSPDGQWLLRRIELNSNILMETDLDPTVSNGNFWRYVDGNPTAWEK